MSNWREKKFNPISENRYLVTDGFNVFTAWWGCYGWEAEHDHLYISDDCVHVGLAYEITHWQPLPTPPNSEDVEPKTQNTTNKGQNGQDNNE